MQKVLVYKPYLCYNVAMQETTTNTTTPATAADQAQFDAQFPSDFDVQDYQDWCAACNEADTSEPFLDDSH